MRFALPTALISVCLLQAANNPQLLLQTPTMNASHIVFCYAGDLWGVPKAGGEARRLTSGPGVESHPVFSPDGATIAFTGEYDGNVDVYTMPANGGIPKRLTWHPASDNVLGWTPDGKRILFSSARESYAGFNELYTVALDGSFPAKLPLPWGWEGKYSADGSRLAYVPMRRAFTAWKNYRGGTSTPIYLATLSNSKIEKVPRESSNDYNPLWIGNKVYFLSDRNGPVTLFSYDTGAKKVKEELKNTGLDFKSAGAGSDAIVLERFGELLLFDLKTGKTTPVPVTLAGDLPEVREHMVNVAKRLGNAHLSPNAARAVFEARGEILTVPAEKGDVRNLTNSPKTMERFPAWSPDGKTIAYFSDESGEYELHLRPQNGTGAVTKIAMPEAGWYREPRWSPDSKKIAFADSHMRMWYVDVATKKITQVDKERFWNPGNDWMPVWSPDSKWMAYSKRLPNYLNAVHVYEVASGKITQVTDGMSDANNPVFDRDGKYLYFSASTNSGPALQPDVGRIGRQSTSSVYLVVLSKEQSSPFAPESDEEKAAAEKTETKPGTPPKVADVKIDFENIGQRILAMPLPPRRYVDLQVGKAGVLFAVEAPQPGMGQQQTQTVHRYDLKTRKTDVAASGVVFFEVSQSGDKMLVRQGSDTWAIRSLPPAGAPSGAPAPPPAAASTSGQLKTSTIEVRVSPRDEWRQMYREAWHVERDNFYDANYHGLDIKAAEKRYEPFLEGISSRADLNYLFSEMLGNFVIGHLFVAGGDLPEVKHVATGLLGCDFTIENGRYRFSRVYNGENWNPDARAPLTQPGVNVKPGEYLLAVAGRDLTATDNVFSRFEATADKQIILRVGADPSGAGARDVTVVPVSSDSRLRNMAWVEDNRRKVDQMTGGKVAYVYLPDTAFGGFTNFTRYFYAQVDKKALIVDERFNGGGMLATDIIETLSRKMLSSVATRDGEDELQPQGAIFGPKTMLINEFAGSGGDAMPWYFRRAGVGKLIGKRTWGGLVGRAVAPPLMDGGRVSAPSSGVWDPIESQWIAENVGVSPDIEVDHDPELVRQGHDPQLEKAVQYIMGELEKNPPKSIVRPKYKKYSTLK